MCIYCDFQMRDSRTSPQWSRPFERKWTPIHQEVFIGRKNTDWRHVRINCWGENTERRENVREVAEEHLQVLTLMSVQIVTCEVAAMCGFGGGHSRLRGRDFFHIQDGQWRWKQHTAPKSLRGVTARRSLLLLIILFTKHDGDPIEGDKTRRTNRGEMQNTWTHINSIGRSERKRLLGIELVQINSRGSIQTSAPRSLLVV